MFAITLNLIISVQGLFAFHDLRNNYNESYHMCLRSLTDKWFDNSFNSFVYVLWDPNDDDIDDILAFDIPRSKVILKDIFPNTTSIKPNLISNNFLFVLGVDGESFDRQFFQLVVSEIVSDVQKPKYKFFIVNHEKPSRKFYKNLWGLQLFNVIILVRSRDKPYEEIKWYWSNPFTAANGCGDGPNVIEEYSCTDSAKVAALKSFRGSKECPVRFIIRETPKRDNFRRYTLTVIDVLQKSFNNVHITVERPPTYEIIRKDPLLVSSKVHANGPVSQEFFNYRWIWILPVPKQLSLIEIYFVIFQKEVWLMVAIGFAVALLLYVAFLALYRLPININRIIFIKLEILSLTVWGSYSRNPRIRAVCEFLLCYSFYATVIQTAYISGLIRVLTIPQYEKGIETLEELADSSIPLYTSYSFMFHMHKDSHEIIRKILPRVNRIIYIDDMVQLGLSFQKYNNISFLTTEDDVHFFLNKTMNETNLIFEDLLFGHNAYVFRVHDHDFMCMIDKSITALKENGIENVFELEEVKHRRSLLPENSHPTDPQVLTMGHLYGIFVIYGIGVCISCIAFVGEIATHYYCNRKRFTPVQVLNAPV